MKINLKKTFGDWSNSKEFAERKYKDFIHWMNHSNGFAVFICMIFIWGICLLPTGFFAFLWWVLGPSTFWTMFVTIVFIGLPLFPFMFGGIVIAVILSIGAAAEIFKW